MENTVSNVADVTAYAVFTVPLLRNWLHNTVVPPMLSADDIDIITSFIVACWTVFTELLPGNGMKMETARLYETLGNEIQIYTASHLYIHSEGNLKYYSRNFITYSRTSVNISTVTLCT
jgi:hypothetical protein